MRGERLGHFLSAPPTNESVPPTLAGYAKRPLGSGFAPSVLLSRTEPAFRALRLVCLLQHDSGQAPRLVGELPPRGQPRVALRGARAAPNARHSGHRKWANIATTTSSRGQREREFMVNPCGYLAIICILVAFVWFTMLFRPLPIGRGR